MQSLKWRIATASLIIVFCNTTLGEISLDGTVGPKASLEGPDYTIPHTVGSTAGTNLFHSFDRFDIGKNERATFTGPAGLENVISRVTGGDPSNIDGTLKSTIPGADFWFLNPSGVFFGPDARVNVPAAFHVSTADKIRFSDGSAFNATKPNAGPLSVASPEAFGFISQSPAGISFQGSKLEVTEGNTLSVVGGDITMKGGSLSAPSGRINVASVASSGEVVPNAAVQPPALELKSFDEFGKIELSQSSSLHSNSDGNALGVIDTSGQSGGSVLICGGELVMKDSAVVKANTLGAMDGGGISVDVEDLTITGGSGFETHVFGSGQGGNIDIAATGTISIRGRDRTRTVRSGVSSITDGSGDAGDVQISSPVLEMEDGTIFAGSRGGQDAGDINLSVGRLILKKGSKIDSSTALTIGESTGVSGDITINATDAIAIGREDEAPSAISSNTGDSQPGAIFISAPLLEIHNGFISSTSLGDGNGGEISLEVGHLILSDDATIISNNTGGGAGGNLNITATESVLITGRQSRLGSETFSQKKAGNIIITTPTLTIEDGVISASTAGNGDAGKIVLEVDRLALTGGATIRSESLSIFGSGRGGNIKVTAKESISIAGIQSEFVEGGFLVNSGIFAQTSNHGDGGQVLIITPTLEVEDAKISTSTFSLFDTGIAGDIVLDIHRLVLTDGASIESKAASFGGARGGNIKVTAKESISISGRESGFSVRTEGAGKAGSITLDVVELVSQTGAAITSSSASLADDAGAAGSIHIVASGLVDLEATTVSTSVAGGSETTGGGNISIFAGNIRLEDGTVVTAESLGRRNAGTVMLSANNLFTLDNSQVTTEAALASGGDITFRAPFLIELFDSVVSSSVGEGTVTDGGNITVDPQFLVLGSSDILANADRGTGGNIQITADFIILSEDSHIDASASRGVDGTVVLSTPEIDLQKGLLELPVVFIDAASQIPRSCEARHTTGENDFTETGRGGLPPDPGGLLPAFYALGGGAADFDGEGGAHFDRGPAGKRYMGWSLPRRVAVVCGAFQ
jgi:filamentous hemagglutinin family protein